MATHCLTFAPSLPPLRNSHGASRHQVSSAPQEKICFRRRSGVAALPRRRNAQICNVSAQLTLPSAPNDEADWVIVDVTPQDVTEDTVPSSFADDVADDAKTLVRVLLRDAAVELSIVLCSDKFIRDLNSQWRQKDTATDVLSFAQNDPDGVVLGDIVISVDTARVQATERAYDLKDEIRVLLVHGLLHLLGYDHEGEKAGDWLVMAQMENKLLTTLGWGGEGLVSIIQPPYLRDIAQS